MKKVSLPSGSLMRLAESRGLDIEVDDMTEEQAKTLLKRLIAALDDLSREDFFGTEGWKHYMGFED